MKTETVLEWIDREMVIAIIRGVGPGQILDTARAIKAGGISNMEITFDHGTPEGIGDTLESIRRVKAGLGDQVNVGAGTVLTAEEAELAAEAGAEYMISPGMDPAVIRRTKELGKISIPGALTPHGGLQGLGLRRGFCENVPRRGVGPGILKSGPRAAQAYSNVRSGRHQP